MIRIVIRNVYLRPDEVADAPEHQRAERAHQENPPRKPAARRCRPVVFGNAEKNCAPMILARRAVEVEIVPLEGGPERGGQDDLHLRPGSSGRGVLREATRRRG